MRQDLHAHWIMFFVFANGFYQIARRKLGAF
jgi:hypothetical protein